MRNVFRFDSLAAVVIATFVSCNSEDYKSSADDVSDTVKDGTWRVGYFYDSGSDKTANYTGYNFVFGNNTVQTASKEANSYNGIWSVARSTSNSDLHSTIFKIAFGSPEILAQLTGERKVVENTGTSLKLRDDSKGDTDVDYLNFEKN